MRTMLLLALISCASDPPLDSSADFLLVECGPNPEAEEPPFVLIAPYPPDAPACFKADDYAARDAWLRDLRDWSRCATLASSRLGGGTAQ